MRRGSDDAVDPGRLEAVEHGHVLGQRDPSHGVVEVVEVGVDRTSLEVGQLATRHLELGAQLDERQHAALSRLDTVARGGLERPHAAEVRRRVLEPVGAGEVDELAGTERRGEVLARLVVEHRPGALGDRRNGSKKGFITRS